MGATTYAARIANVTQLPRRKGRVSVVLNLDVEATPGLVSELNSLWVERDVQVALVAPHEGHNLGNLQAAVMRMDEPAPAPVPSVCTDQVTLGGYGARAGELAATQPDRLALVVDLVGRMLGTHAHVTDIAKTTGTAAVDIACELIEHAEKRLAERAS